MTTREPRELPKIDLPVSEAVGTLTGFEIEILEKHFGVNFEQFSGTQAVKGVLFAYGNRGGSKIDWFDINAHTLNEYNDAFPPEGSDPLGPANTTNESNQLLHF